MRKIIFLFFLSVFFIANTLAYEYDPNSSITGKAISQPIQISIQVIVAPPSISILSPKNSTYIKNVSLMLKISISGGRNIWFNLDGGQNISLFSSVYYFNASEGSHKIEVFADNNDGNVSYKSIQFNVNISKLIILYENFRNNGATTDFYSYSLDELENLANVTFEKSGIGKITFYNNINVTDINSSEKDIIDFDSNIIMKQNYIDVNITELSNLNKKARITLDGILYSNPAILLNGETCPLSKCRIESFKSGKLIFNVSEMGEISSKESPVVIENGGNGGGGGGGIGSAPAKGGQIIIRFPLFEIVESTIGVKLIQGETTQKTITITNYGGNKEHIYLNPIGITDLIKIRENEFDLMPNQTKVVKVDFIAPENSEPKTYIGKIRVSGGSYSSDVLIAIDIEKKNSLFDVQLYIPDEYLNVQPGGSLVSQTKIINLGQTKRVDVVVEYEIVDENGTIYQSSKETIAVETQASLIKNFKLPSNLDEGKYLLKVKISYEDQSAFSSIWFNVNKSEENVKLNYDYIDFLIIVACIMAVISIILIIKNYSEIRYIIFKNKKKNKSEDKKLKTKEKRSR